MGRPEQVILDQLPVEDWDLFIGILWTRFGSAPDGVDPITGQKFGSGTEEEFKRAYESWSRSKKPRIMMYQCIRAQRTDLIDAVELSKVQAFFRNFAPQADTPGLWKNYDSSEELERLVRADVTRYILEQGSKIVMPPPRVIFKGEEFIHIAAGAFKMGSSRARVDELAQISNDEGFSQELPEHEVQLAAYYISRDPVTNATYRRFIEDTSRRVPYRDDLLSRPYNWNREKRTYPDGKDNHPVVLVTWHDADAYCRWFGGRLPSEAEWEKAARGKDGREWPWGNNWQEGRSNSDDFVPRETSPVGRFSPRGDSPYGVVDLSGNVWEWCNSLKCPYPYCADDGRESSNAQGKRVLRGGAFAVDRYRVRCAFRAAADPSDHGFSIGFRVVLSEQEVP